MTNNMAESAIDPAADRIVDAVHSALLAFPTFGEPAVYPEANEQGIALAALAGVHRAALALERIADALEHGGIA